MYFADISASTYSVVQDWLHRGARSIIAVFVEDKNGSGGSLRSRCGVIQPLLRCRGRATRTKPGEGY